MTMCVSKDIDANVHAVSTGQMHQDSMPILLRRWYGQMNACSARIFEK